MTHSRTSGQRAQREPLLGVWGLGGWWSCDWLKPNKGKTPRPPSSSAGTCLRPPLIVGLGGVASPSASSAGLSDSVFLMFTSDLWNDPAAQPPVSIWRELGRKEASALDLHSARVPHARLLPKILLSCLKAGPHQATATPRFMENFRPCLQLHSNCCHPLAGSLEAQGGCPSVLEFFAQR